MRRTPMNSMDAYALAEEEREREEDMVFEENKKNSPREYDILTCPTQKVESENDRICREQEMLFNKFRQKRRNRFQNPQKTTRKSRKGQYRLPGV